VSFYNPNDYLSLVYDNGEKYFSKLLELEVQPEDISYFSYNQEEAKDRIYQLLTYRKDLMKAEITGDRKACYAKHVDQCLTYLGIPIHHPQLQGFLNKSDPTGILILSHLLAFGLGFGAGYLARPHIDKKVDEFINKIAERNGEQMAQMVLSILQNVNQGQSVQGGENEHG
jgi:hypothetical protein